jgi:hypothetical protein
MMFTDVSRYPTTHSCLSFSFPKAGISPFPSFDPQIWYLSVAGRNPMLQPRETLRLGRNVGYFPWPYFPGLCQGPQATFRTRLHTRNTFGTEHREAMTPEGPCQYSITFSEPSRNGFGTRYMRSNSVHGRLSLSHTPLVFEFFVTPS